MPSSKINSFLLLSFIFLCSVSHQSQSSQNGEVIIDWEIKDSLSCYRTLTLDLFQNLKKIIPQYCIQDGENEFKSKIQPRSENRYLITEYGPTKDLFVKGKQQAEDIGFKTLHKIHRCLSYNCSNEKQQRVNKITKKFRNGRVTCGDSEYLDSAISTLEGTCTEVKNEKISSDMKSFFQKDSGFYGMSDRWAKK